MGLIAKIEEKLTGHSKASKAEHDHSGGSHTDSTTHNHNSHGTAPGDPPAGVAATGHSLSDKEGAGATSLGRDTSLDQSTGSQTSQQQAALGSRTAEQTSTTQRTTGQKPYEGQFGSQWVADTAQAGIAKHENEYPEGTAGSLESAVIDPKTVPTAGRGATGGAVQQEARSHASGPGSDRTQSGVGTLEQTRTGGAGSVSDSRQTDSSTSASQSTTHEHQGHHDQSHGKTDFIPNAENASAIPTAGGQPIGKGTDGTDDSLTT